MLAISSEFVEAAYLVVTLSAVAFGVVLFFYVLAHSHRHVLSSSLSPLFPKVKSPYFSYYFVSIKPPSL